MTTPAAIRDRTGRKSLREVVSTAPTHLQRHRRPSLYGAAKRTARLIDALRTRRYLETTS